jgi:hypothetical protein
VKVVVRSSRSTKTPAAVRALGLSLGVLASGCSSINVQPVDYTFQGPLSAIPLGLRPVRDDRKDFAPVFCKAIEQYPGDGTSADCRAYLELDAGLAPAQPLPPLGARQRSRSTSFSETTMSFIDRPRRSRTHEQEFRNSSEVMVV